MYRNLNWIRVLEDSGGQLCIYINICIILYSYMYYIDFEWFWIIIYILCFLHAWNCFPIGRCMRVYMMCLFFVEWFSLHFVYCRKMPKLGRKCRKLFFLNPTVKVIHDSYRDCLWGLNALMFPTSFSCFELRTIVHFVGVSRWQHLS